MAMKMKKNLLFVALSIILFGACASEEHNNITDEKPSVTKTYSSDLLLATEGGTDPEISTRGLDRENGQFTSEYPYDYIYVHSADDMRNGEGHRSLRIPLQDVVFCNGCQGIHLEMDVLDDNAGGGYVVRNKAGESITLAEGESVYFSTIASSYWNANVVDASPVTGSDVFIQDSINTNTELLRSVEEYSEDELIALLSEGEPDIPMSRHCTAFRVYFMFTNVLSDNMGSIDEAGWNSVMGENYGIGNFYIKLYLGPNFTSEYNVYEDAVTDPEEKGFYVTNEQTYQPFGFCEYGITSGTGGMIAFNGYGYMTDLGNYLIAPLNTHLPASDFSVYAFIKYTPDIAQEPDDFLTSDEGAKWFQLVVPSMTLETNRVHYIILAVDVRNLGVFKNQTDTRALGLPEEIKVKSVVKDFVK